MRTLRKLLFAALSALMLTGCGVSPMSLLTGGGPNVAANVQAGAENHQTVGQTQTSDQTVRDTTARDIEQSTGDTQVRTEIVDTLTVNNIDPWHLAILLLFAGFVIPSPQEIARGIRGWFTRK